MIQKIYLFFCLFTILFPSTFAVEDIENQTTENIVETEILENAEEQERLEQLSLNYPREVFKEQALTLDAWNLINDLSVYYPDEVFSFQWDIRGAASREWESIELFFEQIWLKYINLTIFRESGEFLVSKDLTILVYDTTAPLIIQKSFSDSSTNTFQNTAEEQWLFLFKSEVEKERIEDTNILWLIENYRRNSGPKSDYITIWWDRDFAAIIISKLWSELSANDSTIQFKILVISPYNLGLLESFLKNFVVEKPWLQKIILINEAAKFQIQRSPESIVQLEQNLEENGFEYINLNIEKSGIHPLMFISKFINNLSNAWYSSDWIYYIILIPFLFTLLVIIKHLVWLSPIGILVPIGLTLMIFKIWILSSLVFFIAFIGLNVILARIVNTQTLLYTPKISFLIIINIIFAILLINLFAAYGVLDLSLWNSLFIMIYIIILEKLVNVILSKEFNEYRPALMNSIFIGLLWYIVFSSETITSFILSYPELIFILIPLNYFIWKFSWLRVTEYFRFREVIKTTEEE